jgi:hypothetical protein
VPSPRKPSREQPVFHFYGTADGALARITISRPVQRDEHEWTAHLKMGGPFKVDVDVTGVTMEQAIDLALGLCHAQVGGRRLRDRDGQAVRVPGKPLPKPKPEDVDDSRRAALGVCACLVDEENGRVRLVLDDVTRDGSTWTARTFYTHKRYPKKKLRDLALTEKDLAEIGFAVVLRLAVQTFPPKTRAGSRTTARRRR